MRKLFSKTLTASAAAIAINTASLANDDSWYAGIDLGLSAMPTPTFEHSGSGLELSTKTDQSIVGGVYVGKMFDRSRIELEYLVRRNSHSVFTSARDTQVGTGQTAVGRDQKNASIMLNAWHTLVKKDTWALLAGAGVGLSDMDIRRVSFSDASGNQIGADQSAGRVAPTMQVMAQLVRPVGPMELGIGARFVRSAKRTFETSLGAFETRARHNEFFARITWRFGGDNEPTSTRPVARTAPAAQPVVSPAPAPAPVATPVEAKPAAPVTQPVEVEPAPLPAPFIVYFDFDKSNVTARGYRIVSEAAEAFRTHKAVEITASGHADRAGPSSYNEKLAAKRAEAVRDALIREGVPAGSISISSSGETSPAVDTEDGVREGRNRRVVIKLVR